MRIVEEKQRLIRVQKSLLSASKEPHDAASADLLDAIAQLTVVVGALVDAIERFDGARERSAANDAE